ncbi:MAG: glycosyltransferase family 4 protein [Gammaproteobacteria bacterium]|nr:glycosyltransferase family 4 protein [Gammaproteobacteria bacterium]
MSSSTDIGAHLVVGLDASNIRAGGGVTHLAQMLASALLPVAGIRRIIVWGGQVTLARLPEQEWLTKIHVGWLDRNLPYRILWQQFGLPRAAARAGCSVLFSPGGSAPLTGRIPCVTMSQNMLPFESNERRRFGWCSWMYWKLLALRWVQGRSFRRASGVIFLTRYARDTVHIQVAVHRDAVVAHGVEPRFFRNKRKQRTPEECTEANPFRILYVSIIDVYKHQDNVAQAVAQLRARGLPVVVDFIGPGYGPALKRLRAQILQLDGSEKYMKYRGAIAFEHLHTAYAEADAFVFASSCENLPNILLEAMAARLPIASSNRGPMPEILGDAGVYFDPEQPIEIAHAIECLYTNPTLSTLLAEKGQERARGYTWTRCAHETLTFIAAMARVECGY